MKGCFRGKRQNCPIVQKAIDRESRQKGSQGKRDPQPLGPLRLGHRGRSGQWSFHRDFELVMLFEKEQMPLTRSRANRGILFPSPTTPDRLDIGRVRSSPFKKSIQIWTSKYRWKRLSAFFFFFLPPLWARLLSPYRL